MPSPKFAKEKSRFHQVCFQYPRQLLHFFRHQITVKRYCILIVCQIEFFSIHLTFNLCNSWITDTSYCNTRLINSDGKHPVFLGPVIIHFEKSEFLFNRFAMEILSHEPLISELKAIGTDIEKATNH